MKNEITVGVNCELQVSDSTAKGALGLVEVYLNAHSELMLDVRKRPDGTDSYQFITRSEST